MQAFCVRLDFKRRTKRAKVPTEIKVFARFLTMGRAARAATPTPDAAPDATASATRRRRSRGLFSSWLREAHEKVRRSRVMGKIPSAGGAARRSAPRRRAEQGRSARNRKGEVARANVGVANASARCRNAARSVAPISPRLAPFRSRHGERLGARAPRGTSGRTGWRRRAGEVRSSGGKCESGRAAWRSAPG